MMIKVFLSLLCSGLISVPYHNIRFQKLLSLVGALLLGALLFLLYQGWQNGSVDNYSYAWLTSQYYPVNIDFVSDATTYQGFIILLLVALLNMFFMIGDSFERQKVYSFAITCFSLATFLLLICGQNTIQVLVSVCFLDIIGFCLINTISARKRYIFYTLFADMALFMACAILWGSCRTNLISKLALCRYDEKDIAMWLISCAAIVKTGLFPFQAYLSPISVLSLSRRNLLGFLSTPVAGFLILYKMMPALVSYTHLFTTFYYLALVSIFWGGISAICLKKLESKKLALNLVFYGMAYALLFYQNGKIPENLGYLFLIHFCFTSCLNKTQHFLGLSFINSIVLVSAAILITETFDCPVLIFSYLAILILTVGSIVYSLSSYEQEDNNLFQLLLSIVCGIFIIYKVASVPLVAYYWLTAYIILIILRPYRFLSSIYNSEAIQQADGFSAILYFLFAGPILFLGRILWLTVDFLIIERTFLSSLSKFKNVLESLFIWLHKKIILNTFVFWFIGLIILIYCSYGRLK